jgi:uncharacterized damage-inducible protein DinB
MTRGQPLDIERELVDGFERSGLVNAYLVDVLPAELWSADPPSGRGRSIAGIVAHVQSVRRTFGKMGGADPVPPAIDRLRSTPAEASEALRVGNASLVALFRTGLASGRARIKGLPRRTVDMILYLMQHDAHHRGQISTLARDLGHTFEDEEVTRIWGWRKL